MFLSKADKKAIGGTKIAGRTITGLLSLPLKLAAVLGSLFMILFILVGALFLSKFINDNYQSFQQKLKEDSGFEDVIVDFVNTMLGLFNIMQKVLQVLVEIWDYMVPALNLMAYIFYRVIIAVLLTLFGGGVNQAPNDAGDTSLPLGTPDPIGTLSGDTERYFNLLECILIDILTLCAGIFKVWMRALGAMLMVVFEWLDENLKKMWYRQEYCRRGNPGRMGTEAPWSNTTTDPDSGRDIFADGSGPGNTCPDNTVIIQGVIRFVEMVINIFRDIFILVFPIVADILKMIFDALMKILPQIMEGIVKIIEIFGPNAPLGKLLMFVLNFMIQVLGFFLKSCVLQLMMGIVTCLFNVVVAVVINAIRGIIKVLIKVACLGGTACKPKVPGDNVKFPSCSWRAFTSCAASNYDSQSRSVTAICQVSTCSKHIKDSYHPMHKQMKMRSSSFASAEDYKIAYHRECIDTHSTNHEKREETVSGHLFCRYLTEEVHKPLPLGVDPSSVVDTFDDGQELCQDIQESCICKYNSPICESQTCCLTFYTVLVQQILQDMDMHNCDKWSEKQDFAQVYCVSRTQRSLDLGFGDLLGTATHCDGFVALMNQTCHAQPNGTQIDVKGIVGGLCQWVDEAGFCDDVRRPKKAANMDRLDKVVEFYNAHLLEEEEESRNIKRGFYSEENKKKNKNPHPVTSPQHHIRGMAKAHAEIEDHYTVAMFAMSQAFPLVLDMVLHPSYARVLGNGDNDRVRLNRDYMTPDGRLQHVTLSHNWGWQDYDVGYDFVHAVHLNGSHYDWQFLGAVPPTPYNNAGCTSQSTGGYPSETEYNCQFNRITATGQQTGGSITVVTGNGQAQDQVDDMIENSSTQIYDKTTTRPTFSAPTGKYVDIMYDKDMQVPSNWHPSDADRDNTNANWREPLTRKNTTGDTNRPGGTTIYGGARKPPQSLEECPIPTDFPWERVFAKRDTFLTPLRSFIEGIPEWAENNIPDTPNIDIPQDIRDAMHLMYSRRKNNLPKDATEIARAWTGALKSMYELKTSWDTMRSSRTPDTTSADIITQDRWWGTRLQGLPEGAHPSFLHNVFLGADPTTTDLCVNKLLSPYECCTDTATAYECCFGLLGCIPPPPLLNLKKVDNLDQIANATCNGAGNVVTSLLFIPRLTFGTWLWTLIFISPTWLRTLEFRLFYPLIYDYGGLGLSENFLGDAFCFVVNIYYLILVILVCLGLYIIDTVFTQTFREIVTSADIATVSVQAAQAQEYAEIHVKNLQEQISRTE